MPGTVPPPVDTTSDDPLSVDEQSAMLLRAKNIKEFKSVLSLAGTLVWPNGKAIETGTVITFKNKGLFNGNWIVQKVTMHITENKFNTEVLFRKCYIPVKGENVNQVIRPTSDDNTDPDPDDPNNPDAGPA